MMTKILLFLSAFTITTEAAVTPPLTVKPTHFDNPWMEAEYKRCGKVCPENLVLDSLCNCKCYEDASCPDENYRVDRRIPRSSEVIECPGVVCPSNSYMDFQCQCICINNCKENYEPHPETCECTCVERDCNVVAYFDSKSCMCIYPREDSSVDYSIEYQSPSSPVIECAGVVCPSNSYMDFRCQCNCINDCKENFEPYPETCECTCREQSCDKNSYFDFNSCSCITPSQSDSFTEYPSPSSEVIECEGVVCPEGAYLDFTCQCNCPQCPPNFSQDYKTCDCFCREERCDYGIQFDDEKCECPPSKCKNINRNCPDGSIFDHSICECFCYRDVSCLNDNFEFDSKTCDCICPNVTCPDGFMLNQKICECVEDLKTSTTISTTVKSTATISTTQLASFSSSTTTKTSFVSTTTPDLNTTQTPSQTCPPNFVYDEDLCICVCGLDYVEDCPFNLKWDAKKCECICVHSEICKAGYEFNSTRCECSCIEKKCRPNFIFDSETCDCVCGLTKETAKCQKHYIFNPISCECEKDPSRPSGC